MGALCPARLERIERWGQRLVDDGKLPGLITLIADADRMAYLHVCGQADVARSAPLAIDTIFRIYSMTKPLASVAAMLLYEEGHFQLDDPIARFLPCFAAMRVYTGGSRGKFDTVPAERDITFRDLLTHTAGFTYGFMEAHPVDAVYRANGIDFQTSEAPLAELVERLAAVPLIAQPGRAWNYSVATDVLGHLVAVISGQSFEIFLHERVLGPLGMTDTGFHVPAGQARPLRRELCAAAPRRPDAHRRPAGAAFLLSPGRSPPAAAGCARPRPTICGSAG